jgi:hypothetical protein
VGRTRSAANGEGALLPKLFLSEQAKRNIITDLSREKLCDELSRGTLLFRS